MGDFLVHLLLYTIMDHWSLFLTYLPFVTTIIDVSGVQLMLSELNVTKSPMPLDLWVKSFWITKSKIYVFGKCKYKILKST